MPAWATPTGGVSVEGTCVSGMVTHSSKADIIVNSKTMLEG